jgi:hypothetical protein
LRSFRPTPQKRDLRRTSKSSVSERPQNPSPAEGLYKAQVHQAENRSDKRTNQTSRQRVGFNTPAVGEWLD